MFRIGEGSGEGSENIPVGGEAGGFLFTPLNKGLTRKMDTNNTKRKQKRDPNKDKYFLVKPLLRIGQG